MNHIGTSQTHSFNKWSLFFLKSYVSMWLYFPLDLKIYK